jgi:hypothetical protein
MHYKKVLRNERDLLHCENNCAIERKDGTKEWWVNGVRHREDGPAIEHADGSKEWWINGRYHRLDGPAFEHFTGRTIWFVDNVSYIKEYFPIAVVKFLFNCDDNVAKFILECFDEKV